MSDRRIRDLERRIAEGDSSAELILSKELQRSGQRAEYRAAQALDLFWDKFSLGDLFDPNLSERYLSLDVPDPFNAAVDGAEIYFGVEPFRGVGRSPTIRVLTSLNVEFVAAGLAHDDPDLFNAVEDVLLKMDWWSFREVLYANEAYTRWIERVGGVLTTKSRQQLTDNISNMLYGRLISIWTQLETACADLANKYTYVRPNPDYSWRQIEREYVSDPTPHNLQRLNTALERSGRETYLPIEHLEWLASEIIKIINVNRELKQEYIVIYWGHYKGDTVRVECHKLLLKSDSEYVNSYLHVASYRNGLKVGYVEIYPDDVIYIRTGPAGDYGFDQIPQNQPWVYDPEALLDYLLTL